ncbi:MAG TPA: DUF1987 domain-containing protein [Cyclobacteriaceae bacterium]|nr:DUF1987 domain-containing protein [Cyclobacteriaceae bacterium]
MNSLFLAGTAKTPSISFDGKSGKFEISGRSIPENSAKFYMPLIEWVDNYINSAAEDTSIHVRLEYFNTSSLKSLVELFRRFEKLLLVGKQVELNWYYEPEDEDMYESGEDFRLLIRIPVKLIRI